MKTEELIQKERERIKSYAVYNRNIAKQIWPDLK